MKKQLFTIAALLGVMYAKAQTSDYTIKPIPFTNVKLNDKFWSPRIETNRVVTIPASFSRCENTGRVKNFEMAAAKSGKFCTKFPFDDTDIYKTIEGAAYSLAVHPDPSLENYVDSLIKVVGKAQEPDGYLYTARTIDPLHPHEWSGTGRWVKENELSHELYNSGHMFEAAAAYFQATGKRNFLDIALKNADLLVKTFGPGLRHVAPGHEIVEMGLVRLYRITGKKPYLDLAKFFLDERGKRTYDRNSLDVWKNGKYFQDDKPVVDQDEAEGHAVRAMYLYAGMADVAALTGDKGYLHAIDEIWKNMVDKKIYVQGGIGAIPDGERFGNNYELPNATAYNETCAAIGNVFWNQRMFLLHGESKYIDVMEKVLYNGLISGVGLDGKTFFYTNAMQITNGFKHSAMEATRSGWFECSCCPTNMARFLPSLSGYIYAQKADNIFINLFVAGTATMDYEGQKINITQRNNYPWAGSLSFEIETQRKTRLTCRIRIPGWATGSAIPSDLYAFNKKSAGRPVMKVNGKEIPIKMENGYAVINREWSKGDNVQLELPMQVQEVQANKALVDDRGKIALQRGPIVYCAEWKDNAESLGSITIPKGTLFNVMAQQNLLNGVNVLKANVLSKQNGKPVKKVVLTAIPYYSWANRGEGEMAVWFSSEK